MKAETVLKLNGGDIAAAEEAVRNGLKHTVPLRRNIPPQRRKPRS